jgi:transposase-like protein
MMYCSKCKSTKKVKDGKAHSLQRYQCKCCGYRYTATSHSRSKPLSVKRQALELYLEGLGFRPIGRILNVSHVSVYKRIRSFGNRIEDLKSEEKPNVVEIDEMHSYIG